MNVQLELLEMTPDLLLTNAINPALRLLPPIMTTPQAKVIMLAIALQESRCIYRRQVKGPARGFWQFEQGGGVRGVLAHLSSLRHIKNVLEALDYPANTDAENCYVAIEHNDILAAVFARLLLWTLPSAIPTTANAAWDTYVNAWRPGKPHPETWPVFFAQAQEVVSTHQGD